MPTYDYECPKCGRFQLQQRITEPALEVCPDCGSPVRRLISRNIGIIFKGSGFHITDYRSKDYQMKSKEEKSLPQKRNNQETAPPAKTGTSSK